MSLICLSPSCTDWLDLKPIDNIVVEDFWKNASDVEAVVLACYRSMLEDGYMSRIIVGGELRSDNIVIGRGTTDDADEKRALTNILEANILPSNRFVSWGSFYSVINYCNTVLHYAPDVVDIDPDYTKGMLRANEAEALAIRALTYFYLVRIYKEVPYVTEPSIDDTQEFKIPKSSEDAILDQLEEDLISAETYAVKQWPKGAHTKGRVTKNMVRALLADIYLWRSKYDECITMCNKILAETTTVTDILNGAEFTAHDLMFLDNTYFSNPFQEIFLEGNSFESIFELQFDADEKRSTKVFDFYGSLERNGELSATPLTEWGLFRTTDLRGLDSYLPEALGYFNIFKYVGSSRIYSTSGTSTYTYRSSASTTPNWIIYRLPDIMLMKAEALAELETSDTDELEEALEMVNTVFMRSNPGLAKSPYAIEDYSSRTLMQELVSEERQREFLFEGKRWFDLMRMVKRDGNSNRLLSYVLRKYLNQDIVKSKWSIINALYLPIHQDELSSNPALVQNPFYETVLN